MADAKAAMTILEFGARVIDGLYRLLDEKGYVHGDITLRKAPNKRNAGVYSICIEMPDLPGREVCFDCESKYAEYVGMIEYGELEDPAEYFGKIRSQLADAYNECMLRDMRQYRQGEDIIAKLGDIGFVMDHVCAEIIDTRSLSKEEDAEYGETLLADIPGEIDATGDPYLKLAFQLVNLGTDFGMRLRRTHIDPDEALLAKIRDRALKNVNTMMPGKLAMIDGIEYMMADKIPYELPRYVANKLIENIKAQIDTDKQYYIAGFNETSLGSSALPLSRTLMLTIAKRLGASKKIRMIPFDSTVMCVMSADPGKPCLTEGEARELMDRFLEQDRETDRMAITRPFLYDIVMGTIS